VSVLFALGLLVFLQAYIGYPFSMMILARLLGERSRHRIVEATPSVTLVISAYNEERWVFRKLENSLALDYPKEQLSIVVVSDGSTDATVDQCRRYAARGVQVRALQGRRGKVARLNEVIPTLKSDFVVMSDANSMYDPQSIRRLVRHFADDAIGCVCGRLRYENPGAERAGDAEQVYWGYEDWIKKLESRMGSLLGANGSIYAYRRELFRPVDPLAFCDDVIPIRIALSGRRVLYDPEAWCNEETSPEEVELRRRRRHASFGMRSMLAVTREAVTKGRPLIVYQCLCHRVLRWLGGPALIAMLLSTPFLPPPLRSGALAAQGALYMAALAGFLLSRLGVTIAPLYAVYYGIAIHAAGVTGLVNLLLRRDAPFWEPRQ
jgi:poly-beta-1,6-N-acetyl-D-glucosamine synthase